MSTLVFPEIFRIFQCMLVHRSIDAVARGTACILLRKWELLELLSLRKTTTYVWPIKMSKYLLTDLEKPRYAIRRYFKQTEKIL